MLNNLEIHPHQEFHFAENTDSAGCCGFFCSKSRPKEYIIDDMDRLRGVNKATCLQRIIANQRLAKIVESKFENDPIENHAAFERVKAKINDPMNNGSPITDYKLMKVIEAIYSVREELSVHASSS